MSTDWKVLGKKIGTLREDGSESGGDDYAEKALEEILGDDWIKNTVDHIVSLKSGWALATSCLRYIHSEKAALYAYKVYKTTQGERARQAVFLIKDLANPIALDWIEEFLNDENVADWGLGALDQLLWTEKISYDERAKSLLDLADKNSNGHLKEHTDFIRKYIEERNDS